MGSDKVALRLRQAGERVTPQRLAIAAALVAAGRQLTAGELYARLRPAHPRLGRATVFRTVEALVAAGLARRLELEAHVHAYVACQPAHHHHVVCGTCGGVTEIDERYVDPFVSRLADDLGFEVDDARLDFYGRCARCAA